MRVLSECDNVLCDGTFKAWTSPYLQLYVIIGFWENRFLALVFSFFPEKLLSITENLSELFVDQWGESQDRRGFPKES